MVEHRGPRGVELIRGRRRAAAGDAVRLLHERDEPSLVERDVPGGDELAGLSVVTGGRSSGARVACRTAEATGSVALLCLAFPVHPPGRPEKSRLDELDAVRVPVLVVQGSSDPFGMPPARRGRKVVRISGNHSLRTDVDTLRRAVRNWLRGLTITL